MQSPPNRSVPVKLVAGFALRFALVYGLLVLAWPTLRPVYRQLYCALGNVLFSGGEGSARFRPLEAGPDGSLADLDIQIVLTKRGHPPVTARMGNSSRLIGYMPMVSLIALVLATPLAWKRRRRALLLGLLLVTAFVGARMAIPIQRDFSRADALQIHHPGAFARWLLDITERAFLKAPASFFVVPIFIWILVTFRRQDGLLDGSQDSRKS
ncbi:MAG: hypothetical protein HOP15_02965 [Planctomycetes bacterium]|nr:hypothetical protein [Planctomycetota bacterium]